MIDLPTTGKDGTTITWMSSDPTVIDKNGKVTRPTNGFNKEVTLTATISKNGATETKKFAIIVLDISKIMVTDLTGYSDITAIVNQAINTQMPTLTPTGATGSYSISPNLTANTDLTFDTITGTISGTPTTVAAETTYTVAFTGNGDYGGKVDFAFQITINPIAITDLTGYSDIIAIVNQAINTQTPTLTPTGATGSYSISPNLTANTDLTFDTITGTISGTPTKPVDPVITYTVTFTGNGNYVGEADTTFQVLARIIGLTPIVSAETATPTFSWDEIPNAASYELQISDSEAGVWTATIKTVSSASYTLTSALPQNILHYWRVRAKDSSGQPGDWSDIVSVGFWNYSIGDTGPAGGKIFYDKGDYTKGWRYLEGSPSNQPTLAWGGTGTDVVGTSTAMGTGKANTESIVNTLGNGNYAAKHCYDLKLGNYDDWFLPSIDELNELYKQRSIFGNFSTLHTYLSSSESTTPGLVYYKRFDDVGQVGGITKKNAQYVRAIRAF